MGENSKKVTKSADQTKAYGKSLAKTLQGGDIVALYGDLGSGKTTFAQGLAVGLGITQRIVSPTFIIMRTYEIKGKGESVKGKETMFYHLDLYRTQTAHDIEGLGLLEIMQDQNNIVVIEWPEKMGNALPKHARKIQFTYINENEREILSMSS